MADELDPIARRALKIADGWNGSTGYPWALLDSAGWFFAELVPAAREREAILARQQAKGVAKYGVTVSRANLTPTEWREHAKQEAADLLVYLLAEEAAAKGATT